MNSTSDEQNGLQYLEQGMIWISCGQKEMKTPNHSTRLNRDLIDEETNA